MDLYVYMSKLDYPCFSQHIYIYIYADVDDELKENSDHMYQSYIYMAIYVYIILPWMPMDGLIA